MASLTGRITVKAPEILEQVHPLEKNCMLLESRVSVFYWALEEAKHFTLGHQIIMHLRLPITSEVLLDH